MNKQTFHQELIFLKLFIKLRVQKLGFDGGSISVKDRQKHISQKQTMINFVAYLFNEYLRDIDFKSLPSLKDHSLNKLH